MTFQEELKASLVPELDILEKLLKLSHTKTEAILNNDLGELSKITSIEEKLVGKIMELEEKRIKVLDNWGISIATPISDVIDMMDQGREEFNDLNNSLRDTIEKLKIRNKANGRLIEQNLEWVEFNLNVITSTEAVGAYGEDSQNKEHKNKLFDRKV